MGAITLNVGGDTSQLYRDIQKTVNKTYNINLKTKGDQPLGRITGQVTEFNKSLAASNARVIAFGASAGIIYGVQKAFNSLVSSTIEVQKSLQDINVILNVSTSQLNKFGSDLFSIAKNTGQSFQDVAAAATEFSRQGLGVEETLKRTSDALILSRLSGLDTIKSVEALTAAVNSFANQAVTASEVVNKFANVDAAFAVSSGDLAEAISRVGSSASQSGVNLNELIAIVTSAQQTTARGGAVIGNSFKTIFTRLQRGKVIDLLESLGVGTTDSTGQLKSTIDLLKSLADVYGTLGTAQQSAVAEKVGGVFQINILKAALADLGKEYSVYNNALNVAASSTDQAIKRNAELNKTYSAQLNVLQENAKQISSSAGERLLGPVLNRTVGNLNDILGGINASDANSFGAVLGKGILDGLGQVLAGPGLILIGGVLIKLFRDFASYGKNSVKELLGLNAASKEQANLQLSVNQILQKNPGLIDLALKGEQGLAQAALIVLDNFKAQTLELERQQSISAKIATQAYTGGVRVIGGVPTTPKGKAAGFIPNFISEKAQAMALGATSSVRPHMSKGTIGGRKFVMNSQETEYPGVGRNGDSMVIPHYAARGFIPNFALDTIANLKAKASRSGGLLGNLYDIGEDNFFDKYEKPAIKRIPLQKNVSQYTKVADAFIRDIRKRASSDPNSVGSIFNNLRYKGTPISQFTDKIKPQTLLDPRKDRSNNTNIKGALGEIDSQKRFGSGSRTAEKQGDLFGADFLVKKQGTSYLVESKVTQRKVPDNILIAKALQYEGQITGGKYKKNDINDEIKLKNIILSYAPFKNAASGFIPNFAQGKNAIDLGDTRTSAALKGKVLSLIYPGISDGYSMSPATASYLGQQYKGLIPVAGINKQALNSELPDLNKNLGDLLVREANQFGSAIGGKNFLKSPDELPNYGAAKGAVGVAFEGGLLTLLKQNIQQNSAQNAGIDFRQNRITPKLRNLFHGAPGMYDAKYSSDLTNDVFLKLLQEAKVGEVKQAKSGSNFKGSQALRAQALKNLQGQNLRRGPQLEKAIKEEMARLGRGQGAAAGFIPNFAAPLVRAVDNKELKMMLSKFGKGGAFQNRSSDQSALEYFGGSGTYMWDALSRPGEQMSDRQAYKQNVGRAKNWASARKESSWLVRYNRSKLKDSELLPDMETGGASVYGLPLNKDQIVWPIKQSNGTGRIFEKDIPAFLNRGMAGGFIPNFSSTNRGVPVSQIRAHFDKNGSPIAVTNTRDEPNGLKDAIGRERKGIGMYSRGFVPNFADEQAAGIGNSILSVGTQLSSLALILGTRKEDINKSLIEIGKANRNEARAKVKELKAKQQSIINEVKNSPNSLTSELRASIASVDIQNIDKKIEAIKGQSIRPGIGQKAMAAVGGGGGLAQIGSFVAPMIAATVANAVPQDTKVGRATAAGITGLGNVASMAGTGFLLGGPWGAAIGGLVGAGMALTDVISQASTDIPELGATAKKASEELSQANDATQKIQTTFEQISNLRAEGNNAKADELQKSLLGEVAKQFSGNPEAISGISNAIGNLDSKGLQKALAKNTDALFKKQQKTERDLTLTTNIEKIGGGAGQVGSARSTIVTSGEGVDKRLERAGKIAETVLSSLDNKNISVDKINQAINSLNQDVSVVTEDYIRKPLEGIPDLSQDFIDSLIANNVSAEGVIQILQSLRDKAGEWKLATEKAVPQTKQVSESVKKLNKILENITKNFQSLQNLSAQNFDLKNQVGAQRQQSQANVRQQDLTGQIEIAKEFGATNTAKDLSVQSGMDKINSDFAQQQTVASNELGQVLYSALNEGINTGLSNAQTGKGNLALQNVNSENFGTVQATEIGRLATRLNPSSSAGTEVAPFYAGIQSTVDKIISEQTAAGGGFDMKKITEAIKSDYDFSKLDPSKQEELLQKIQDQVAKSNGILATSEEIQKEQTQILANQKFTEAFKELIQGAKMAGGGVDKYLSGETQKYGANMAELSMRRQSLMSANTGLSLKDTVYGQTLVKNPMSAQATQDLGRYGGNYLDQINNLVGRNVQFNPNNELRQQETAGLASNIQQSYETAKAAATTPGEKQAFGQGRTALLQEAGFAADYKGPMTDVFKKLAEIQTNAKRETGTIDQGIKAEALKTLSPEMQAAALKGGLSENSILIKQNDDQLKVLQEIANSVAESKSIGQMVPNMFSNINPTQASTTLGAPPVMIPVSINIGNAGGVDTESYTQDLKTSIEQQVPSIIAAIDEKYNITRMQAQVQNMAAQNPSINPPPSTPQTPPK